MSVSGTILKIHYHYGAKTIPAIDSLLANTSLCRSIIWVFFPSGEPLGILQARSVHHEPITPLAYQSWATTVARFNDKMNKPNHYAMLLEGIARLLEINARLLNCNARLLHLFMEILILPLCLMQFHKNDCLVWFLLSQASSTFCKCRLLECKTEVLRVGMG